MLARVPFVLLTFCVSLSLARTKNPKRGLGYAGTVPGDIINANQTNSLISWEYNWSNLPPDYLATSNIPYVPMQWGSVGIDTFADNVKAQGAKTILSFNEPDFDQESNILPEDAAKLWMQFLEPLKASGIRLGGPAVTNSPTGRPWLVSFLQACSNCTIDFLPLHWYGSGLDSFYGYIFDVHNQFPQYPIWITEYAETSPNDTVVFNFMNATITAMDSLSWIERYSWFGYFRPRPDVHYNMLDDNGGLNALGQLYLGAKTVHTEVVTSAPTPTYHTVNGADNPTQAPATTWPALLNSSPRRVSVPEGLQLLSLLTAMAGILFGLMWNAL
ncbi:Alkali-sensitive linkage protein 1 [Psilocybe cubensis]|uniref:Asl1-like glycosyl hydrolase catalytic domain-containing protein n=2 Tax=Psilocybe cubensis TaxID=181762 RepID=A0A8H8CQB5_PSICU|nr:Alkali-sensitive linkage protein 1 [Psilocybe cubensis]KAH9486438.1 Alkali-sensitive linkage protein 1 [Psilocybe cubensis]